MRTFATILGFGTLLIASGCADSKWGFLRNKNNDPPRTVGLENPTAADLVGYLNRNSQRIQSLQCQDLDMDIKMRQSFGIRGWLVCQKPNNFRMRAEALGKDAADIGSNDQEFWYWVSKSEPPYLLHCTYADLAKGVEMPFPFRPEWVMEALGMGEYGTPESYRLESDRSTFRLVQQTTTSQGQQVRKITVFSRAPSSYQVLDHILQDASGRQICAAHINGGQYINGAVVPKKIVFTWPAQGLQLTMKLDDVTVNTQFDRERALALFSRPSLAGVQSYDLARRGLDAPVNQAGSFSR